MNKVIKIKTSCNSCLNLSALFISSIFGIFDSDKNLAIVKYSISRASE